MEPITVWYRLNERGSLEFNHIESGRLPRTATLPTPKTDEHKRVWATGTWVPFNAKLSDDLPARVI